MFSEGYWKYKHVGIMEIPAGDLRWKIKKLSSLQSVGMSQAPNVTTGLVQIKKQNDTNTGRRLRRMK